ncbi:Bacterial alpha-L-rhamnosidase, partial [Candidatus Poribacteria bacterium]|nr:Bacterial alpha-L-rhamnosidase [Candidatus Poribacteria bacterium]
MENQTSHPSGLMCELMEHPKNTSITNKYPSFSWIVNDEKKNSIQTAYQIIVASNPDLISENKGDMWDTGQVESSESINIKYNGHPLQSHKYYYWKVKTWNHESVASDYSKVQKFYTGELSHEYKTAVYTLEKSRISPVNIVEKGKGHYFVDFGKDAFGTVELILESTINTDIVLHLGEMANEDFTVNRNPGGTIRYREIKLPVKKGKHTYQVEIPPDKRNTGPKAIKMPPEVGEVLPFRYCEIAGTPGKITPHNISQIAVNYPFNEDASHFESSNETLNAVWDICKYSIKATSFCGVYIDGDRERIPYEADAYINQLGHYCVDREFTLARQSHEYLIYNPTWPTEWFLHSVLMAWADYMYTGNTRSLEYFYTDLKAKTLIALEREDGLISTRTGLVTDEVLKSLHFDGNIRDIVDWPPGSFTKSGEVGEQDGYVFTDINTVVNSFHYMTLNLASRMASVLGKNEDESLLFQKSELVKESINEKLLDKDKGIYIDGEGTDHSALHA